jgi:hypothetical protein
MAIFSLDDCASGYGPPVVMTSRGGLAPWREERLRPSVEVVASTKL